MIRRQARSASKGFRFALARAAGVCENVMAKQQKVILFLAPNAAEAKAAEVAF